MPRSRALSSNGSGRRSTWSGWPAPTGASSSECRWGYCVLYPPGAREVVLARRPLVLLRFKAPSTTLHPTTAPCWRIDRGLLVTPRGLVRASRIAVRRTGNLSALNRRRRQAHGHRRGVELLSDAPRLRLVLFVGRFIYRFTQQRIHVIVTKAFLRSLARLDLVPSVVGQLTEGGGNGSADGV